MLAVGAVQNRHHQIYDAYPHGGEATEGYTPELLNS